MLLDDPPYTRFDHSSIYRARCGLLDAYGITSKGPWRSSKTPGINQALSNAYLKSEGLYELRDGMQGVVGAEG